MQIAQKWKNKKSGVIFTVISVLIDDCTKSHNGERLIVYQEKEQESLIEQKTFGCYEKEFYKKFEPCD
jgi:hypothetical protein